jgi:hypothetical protein
LVAFAFALGAGTTFAEPALIAVAAQAAELRAGDGELAAGASQSYQRTLRVTVALAVGVALVMGVLRIVMGWPAYYLLLPAYLLFVILTPFAPRTVVGLAYDIGAMTMSTVTVPLTAALGIGLASSIKGRSPLTDGFGVIALAAIIPSLSVLVRGIVWP